MADEKPQAEKKAAEKKAEPTLEDRVARLEKLAGPMAQNDPETKLS